MKFFKSRVNTSMNSKPCELHSCLRHAMRLARWFGVFPVEGLDHPTPSKLRYKMKSVYGFYYSFFVIVQATLIILTLLWHMKINASFGSVSIPIFFSISLISTISFLIMAKRWPKLMQTAAEIEEGLSEIKIPKHTALISHIVAYGVMLLALGEHALYINYNITTITYCLREEGTPAQVTEYYLRTRFSYIFHMVPYNMWFGLMAIYFGIQVTFVWTFINVLIICFSIYLMAYFKAINRAITIARNSPSTSWGQLRAHYSRVVILVQEINSSISIFILISMFTDLLYICLQLFNSMHRSEIPYKNCSSEDMARALLSPTYLLYYLYSFLFLVFRTILMSLSAANVHTEALKPIAILYDVSACAYDMEVKRFIFQLRYTTVGLSGYFFCVTRTMMLKIISTIITYELVLLQLSRPDNADQSHMASHNALDTVTTALVP